MASVLRRAAATRDSIHSRPWAMRLSEVRHVCKPFAHAPHPQCVRCFLDAVIVDYVYGYNKLRAKRCSSVRAAETCPGCYGAASPGDSGTDLCCPTELFTTIKVTCKRSSASWCIDGQQAANAATQRHCSRSDQPCCLLVRNRKLHDISCSSARTSRHLPKPHLVRSGGRMSAVATSHENAVVSYHEKTNLLQPSIDPLGIINGSNWE